MAKDEEPKKLEEKLFDITDWIPIIGGINLIFNRRNRMDYELKNSLKHDIYIYLNGIWNGLCGYELFKLIN